MIDLNTLPMEQLTSHHNRLVSLVHKEGGDQSVYRPMVKLSNRASGVRRCEDLARLLENKELIVRKSKSSTDPATHPPGTSNGKASEPAAAAARAPRVRDPNAPPTIRSLTEKFNALVPEAIKAGVTGAWVKEHTSDFASRDGANKQIARLQAEIEKAKSPAPPVTDGAGNEVAQA